MSDADERGPQLRILDENTYSGEGTGYCLPHVIRTRGFGLEMSGGVVSWSFSKTFCLRFILGFEVRTFTRGLRIALKKRNA